MPPKTKITLTDAQKYEFCLYAHHNPGTRIEYVNWIENKWNVRVSESTGGVYFTDSTFHRQCNLTDKLGVMKMHEYSLLSMH